MVSTLLRLTVCIGLLVTAVAYSSSGGKNFRRFIGKILSDVAFSRKYHRLYFQLPRLCPVKKTWG